MDTAAKVTNSDPGSTDHFGFDVAIYANYAVVGAYKDDDSNGTDSGTVYAFSRSGTTWTQQQKILASDGGR